MTENTAYFLECETKDKDLSMTTFAPALAPLLSDYAEWLRANERTPGDIAFARLYRLHDSAFVATLDLEDGAVILKPRRVYEGPFSKLIHQAIFDLRLRWRFLVYAVQGIHVSFTEEHVKDESDASDAPDDDPDGSDDPQDSDDLDVF